MNETVCCEQTSRDKRVTIVESPSNKIPYRFCVTIERFFKYIYHRDLKESFLIEPALEEKVHFTRAQSYNARRILKRATYRKRTLQRS